MHHYASLRNLNFKIFREYAPRTRKFSLNRTKYGQLPLGL